MSVSSVSDHESMDEIPFVRGNSNYPDLASGLKAIPIAPRRRKQNGQSRNLLAKRSSNWELTSTAGDAIWWESVTVTTEIDTIANANTAGAVSATAITKSVCSANVSSTALITAIPIDPTEWHWFAKCPPEIRIMIWSATIIPRIVSFDRGGGNAPGAMFVNRESCAVYRQYYEYCGGACHPNLSSLPRGPRFGIYLNPEIDILHVNPFCNRLFKYLKNAPQEDQEAVEWRDTLSGQPAADWAVLWLYSDYPILMAKIKYIAFDLESEHGTLPVRWAWSLLLTDPDWALSLVCPALKNIFVVQDNDIGTNVEDLEISDSGTLAETDCMNGLLQTTDEEFHELGSGLRGHSGGTTQSL